MGTGKMERVPYFYTKPTKARPEPKPTKNTLNLFAELEKAKDAMDKAGYAYRVGSVATGEWFATECDRARWIAETFHPLLIEMEGGAAAQVCYRNEVPFMALKSVSDCVLEHHDFYFNFPEAMKDLNRVAMAFLDGLEG